MKNMFVFFVTLTPKKISYIWQCCFIYAHVTVLHTTLLESLSEGKCAIHCLHYATFVATACCTNVLDFTSSNFSAIMENALKMPSVGPVMVTILSGDDPSDMLMRAPLWKQKSIIIPTLHYARNPCPDTWFRWVSRTWDTQNLAHLLSHFLHCFSFLGSCRNQWNERGGLISYNKEELKPTANTVGNSRETYLANYAANFLQYKENKG